MTAPYPYPTPYTHNTWLSLEFSQLYNKWQTEHIDTTYESLSLPGK